MSTPRILVLIGSILLILGSILPWGQMGIITISGLTGDGIFSFSAAIILLIGALATKGTPGKTYSGWITYLSALLFLFMLYKTFTLLQVSLTGPSAGMVSIGSGIWISILGAILSTIGGILTIPQTTA